jgi:hypothetical protein
MTPADILTCRRLRGWYLLHSYHLAPDPRRAVPASEAIATIQASCGPAVAEEFSRYLWAAGSMAPDAPPLPGTARWLPFFDAQCKRLRALLTPPEPTPRAPVLPD